MGNLTPKVLVLGALGRSGRGAVDVLDSLGCHVSEGELFVCFGNFFLKKNTTTGHSMGSA